MLTKLQAENRIYDLVDSVNSCRAEFRDKHELSKNFGIAVHELHPNDLSKSLKIFNIGRNIFISDDYCSDTAIQFYKGNHIFSKKTLGNKGSRIRSLKNILSFSGPYREMALQHMQLSDDYLGDLNQEIGFHLLNKAFDVLNFYGVDHLGSYKAGLKNGATFLKSLYNHQHYSSTQKHLESLIYDHHSLVERNRFYKIIKAAPSSIRIEMTESDLIKEALYNNPRLAESWREIIRGFFDSFTYGVNTSSSTLPSKFLSSNCIEIKVG